MIDDLNLSNILPWDTAETQVPINRLQLINNVVSQLPKEKNRLQQTKSIKAQLPQSITHRKVILFIIKIDWIYMINMALI